MIKFENKTNGRYYYLQIQHDIFNDVVLTIIRGGISTRVVKNQSYNDLDQILIDVARLTQRRLKRGYTLIQ